MVVSKQVSHSSFSILSDSSFSILHMIFFLTAVVLVLIQFLDTNFLFHYLTSLLVGIKENIVYNKVRTYIQPSESNQSTDSNSLSMAK